MIGYLLHFDGHPGSLLTFKDDNRFSLLKVWWFQ